MFASALALLVAVARPAPAEPDLLDRVLSLYRDAKFVVVGRVARVGSCEHPEGVPGVGTRGTAAIQVTRHLKGDSDQKILDVAFEFASSLGLRPDDGDVVWPIRGEQRNGRYLVRDWKWGTDSVGSFEYAAALTDKTTRTPGMPRPTPDGKPLSVVLAADDGTGRAVSAVPRSIRHTKFFVQFENHDRAARSVMPCLHGSEQRKRFPHCVLEMAGPDGEVVTPRGGAWCPTVAPLAARDVVPLNRGEVFRTPVALSWGRYPELTPGRYKVRLRYTARQDARVRGICPEPGVAALVALATVWEGELVSNWVDVEIAPPDDKKP
jgi:hypothetical protein